MWLQKTLPELKLNLKQNLTEFKTKKKKKFWPFRYFFIRIRSGGRDKVVSFNATSAAACCAFFIDAPQP